MPPLVLSAFAGKLDVIFTLTGLRAIACHELRLALLSAGLFAFFLELIIPCLLQYLSIRYCQYRWFVAFDMHLV